MTTLSPVWCCWRTQPTGTFSGSTIADSETVKGALQDLETEVELKCATGANVNTLVGATSADSEPANYLFLVVSTADGFIKAINKEFVGLRVHLG